MFKIKKEKPLAPIPAQMAGSMGHVADAARDNLTWLISGIAVAVVMVIAIGGYFGCGSRKTVRQRSSFTSE